MSQIGTRPLTPDEEALLDSLFLLPISNPNQAIQKTSQTTFGNINVGSGSGSGTVTSIATAGLISGGPITTTGTITTKMSTGKLVGRTATGTGIMQEITVGPSLLLNTSGLSIDVSNSNSWTGAQYFADINGDQALDTFARQLTNPSFAVMFDWSDNLFRPDLDIQFPNEFTVFKFGSDPSATKSGLPMRVWWTTGSSSNGWLQFDDGAGNLQVIRANINAEEVNSTSIAASSGSVGTFSTNDLTAGSITNASGLAHGTYTPTLTNTLNVSSSTAIQCMYMRVGNVVTVAGMVSVTATSNNTETKLGISLPISSTFSNPEEAAGTAHTTDNSTPGHGGSITAVVAGNRVELDYYETHGSADLFSFSFTYRVI